MATWTRQFRAEPKKADTSGVRCDSSRKGVWEVEAGGISGRVRLG